MSFIRRESEVYFLESIFLYLCIIKLFLRALTPNPFVFLMFDIELLISYVENPGSHILADRQCDDFPDDLTLEF